MFWNSKLGLFFESSFKLTVNMKCFEIILLIYLYFSFFINRKHEMFWNAFNQLSIYTATGINRKHEMFWNWIVCFSKFRSSNN